MQMTSRPESPEQILHEYARRKGRASAASATSVQRPARPFVDTW